MASNVTQRFIDGLTKLEQEGDPTALVAVFADDCEVGNVVSPRLFRGREGARDFWTRYRESFGDLESRFRNVIVDDGRAALEWTTTGTSSDGESISYDGISVLEITDDQVTRFRAFFNPASLEHELGKASR